jgi:2-methylisocitrate lyase-like PEP mutase family enzyme
MRPCATRPTSSPIEDATGNAADPIYEFNLSVERVAAAAEAAHARSFPFTFVARAENFLHGRNDLDDTIRRLQAYEKAGADVLFAPGLPNLDAIRTVCASVTKPVNVVLGAKNTPYSLADLAAAGVRRVSTGSSFARAALTGLRDASMELLGPGTATYLDNAITFAEVTALMAPKR